MDYDPIQRLRQIVSPMEFEYIVEDELSPVNYSIELYPPLTEGNGISCKSPRGHKLSDVFNTELDAIEKLYIKLPLANDGEPIVPGDCLDDDCENYPEKGVVESIRVDDHKDWSVHFHDGAGWNDVSTHEFKHVKKESLQDILNSLVRASLIVSEGEICPSDEKVNEVVKEYEKRIREAIFK